MNYVWGGKFHHILGKNDKGKAVEILKELYENQFFSISTIGIGDSLNDLPMLFAVDHPFFLRGEDNIFPEGLSPIQNLVIVNDTGPQAWNEAIWNIIERRSYEKSNHHSHLSQIEGT
jgi:mannosyl-3-phosphoglycerate phosphatase